MQLTALLLATVASASPLIQRQTTQLLPWEITGVGGHSPSGRPGNDPHSTITIWINNPNTIPVRSAPHNGNVVLSPLWSNCTISWIKKEDIPWGVPQPCQFNGVQTGDGEIAGDAFGTFTVTIREGDGEYAPQGDFNVDIKEFREMRPYNELIQRTYEGSAKFKIGLNMRQVCGGSGVCNWGLSDGLVTVQQTLTESVGGYPPTKR
ncbi:hypothetical protein BU24DRAFT_427296 [Aaosphaeria arxii CBS 175.79]|uniref:Cell death in tomato 1 n=1 Tax=Aaosphaeria arxii CBS 175.79 TaxID=1450172 RepID=A0A6A5XE20_9PLEO|nr:uncharacterized protein BU24DRAFT_427296 [Aaosphaeria arxii CBS 175.79]KAF2011086.1 hypothetical protein BU24DRAFT_427296 [Aaosphaeria arxii CBS 175.79]